MAEKDIYAFKEKMYMRRIDLIRNEDFSHKNKLVEKIEGEINELKDKIFSEKIEKTKGRDQRGDQKPKGGTKEET